MGRSASLLSGAPIGFQFPPRAMTSWPRIFLGHVWFAVHPNEFTTHRALRLSLVPIIELHFRPAGSNRRSYEQDSAKPGTF